MERHPQRAFRLPALLFPLAVFAAATFFLLGDLGKWTDDWYYIQRDPATGEIQALYLDKPIHVFRPFFRATISTLQTLLWRHDRVNHLITASAHALAVALVWRLLLAMNFTRLAAACGAMLFAFYPVHFEVIFWCGALPTACALATTVAALRVGIDYGRARRRGWAVPAVGALAFGAACFNEQAPLLLVGLPFLTLAVRPDGAPGARAFLRGTAAAGAAGLALAAYVAIHRAMDLPRPTIGEDAMIASPDRMGAALRDLLYWGRGRHLLHDFSRPASAEGARAIAAHPVAAAIFGALIVAGLGPWLARHARTGDDRPAPDRPPRVLPILGAGAVMLIAAWSPVVVFTYWLMPRLAYAPTLALALLLALGVDVASRHTSRRPALARGLRIGIAATAAGVSLAFALMLIGAQSRFQSRACQDLAEVESLRAMVPDPAPGSVFAPVRVAPPVARPRAGGFDAWFQGAMSNWWSAKWIIRFAYRRSDLDSGYCEWDDAGLVSVTADGAEVFGVGFVGWDALIPFEIDAAGRVRLIHTIVVVAPGGSREAFGVPHVRGLDAQNIGRAGYGEPTEFLWQAP